MVRDRNHAGTKLDSMRSLRGRGQKHLRRRDRLPSARMMLPDPELVVAKSVEQRGEFEIALQLEHRMLADRMMRREKNAKSKPVVHDEISLLPNRVLSHPIILAQGELAGAVAWDTEVRQNAENDLKLPFRAAAVRFADVCQVAIPVAIAGFCAARESVIVFLRIRVFRINRSIARRHRWVRAFQGRGY